MSGCQVTCGHCGDSFGSAWTDEEAEAEAVKAFGAMPAEAVLVCDDCYEAIMVFNGHEPSPRRDLTEFERYIRERLQAGLDEALWKAPQSAGPDAFPAS